MIVSIADTHAAIWYLFNDPRLSRTAQQAFHETAANGDHVGVSSISLAEMVYLCEKGKTVATAVEDLIAAFKDRHQQGRAGGPAAARGSRPTIPPPGGPTASA